MVGTTLVPPSCFDFVLKKKSTLILGISIVIRVHRLLVLTCRSTRLQREDTIGKRKAAPPLSPYNLNLRRYDSTGYARQGSLVSSLLK